MRVVRLLIALSLAAFAQRATPVAGQEPARDDDLYVVADYDSNRDPFADLELAVTRAQAEGKRIILEVGGTWCVWCKILDRFIEEDSTVAGRLREGFVIVKVDYDLENRNERFLSRYPEIPGYPHFYVLESDGTFLHSQPTEELEEGRSYNGDAFLRFLENWAPSRNSADARERG